MGEAVGIGVTGGTTIGFGMTGGFGVIGGAGCGVIGGAGFGVIGGAGLTVTGGAGFGVIGGAGMTRIGAAGCGVCPPAELPTCTEIAPSAQTAASPKRVSLLIFAVPSEVSRETRRSDVVKTIAGGKCNFGAVQLFSIRPCRWATLGGKIDNALLMGATSPMSTLRHDHRMLRNGLADQAHALYREAKQFH